MPVGKKSDLIMQRWLLVITILIFSCSSQKGDTKTGICLNRPEVNNVIEVKWSDFAQLAKMRAMG